MRTKADAQQLTVADDAAAFLTDSRRLKKPGLLARMTKTGDPDTEHRTALVIGAKDVLVCTHGEQRGTAVLTARLEDVDTEDKLAAMRNDSGVSVNGFPVSGGEGTGRGSFFVGLGAPGRRRREGRPRVSDPRCQGLAIVRTAHTADLDADDAAGRARAARRRLRG